jgi:hypothetical protein
MSVAAAWAVPEKRSPLLENISLAIFVALTAVTAYRHEPWADEANSWLLGRDASLFELWTHLMHYEGTPAVWQTLLHILIRLGFPYSGLNFFTGFLGCAAAWMFIRKAPFPLPVRVAMPFTFYLFYQYSVVARSYCLLPVLILVCAWMYGGASRTPGIFTCLLCLMAGISVHGMIISGAIWISFQWEAWRIANPTARNRLLWLGFVYAAVVLLLAWSAWPAKDNNFSKNEDPSLQHLVEAVGETLANAFTGEWISSLAVIALCVPFLWRGRGLLMFALSGAGLLLFNGLVYANVWHEGMLFLAWLFAIWISGERTEPKRLALIAMTAVIGVQVYWALDTAAFDWKSPYSGSRAAARYMRENGIVGSRVFGFGYACVGIQPYFSRNIFPNFRDGKPQSYFDWSESWRNFGPEDELAKVRPEYVIFGLKDDEDKEKGFQQATEAGYKLLKSFDGNLFWHTEILEPDAFDLYKRN